MSLHLCVTIRFLHPVFHGRGLDDEPEWPPSPLRIFQALVATAARIETGASAAQVRLFEYLERSESAPTLIAPEAVVGDGYRLSVPNNDLDDVGAAWSRGNYFGTSDANPSKHRSMKRVNPVHLPTDAVVHCAWPLSEASDIFDDALAAASSVARNLTSLGWGVDLAVGEARLISDKAVGDLPGTHWLPFRTDMFAGLRVPVAGTFDELQRRHRQFLFRVGNDGLRPPEPLFSYRVVEYRRASDPVPRPVACFELQRPEGGYRVFDPPRNTVRVAAMLRHAAGGAADESGWPDRAGFVLGHGEAPGAKHRSLDNRRFAYLPLPSIQPRGQGRALAVGSIRRVCVAVLEPGHGAEVDWAKRALAGAPMIREDSEGEIAALLVPAAIDDSVTRRYLGSASDWATVSPVVLPGFDDPAGYRRRLREPGIGTDEQHRLLDALHQRVDRLLRKAIRDGGFPDELARHADLDWRAPGFWPGLELAGGYTVPGHLTRYPRLHVRLRWRDASGKPVRVAGPLCLGGGRFSGIGLFAALDHPGKGLDQPDSPTSSGG